MDLTPHPLTGTRVWLVPLSLAHLPGLCAVGLEPELWRFTPMQVSTPEQMRAYVEDALAAQAAGTALPFATVDAASGEIIGSTRFANASPPDRRVEIGWTWIGRDWQRTHANTEAKYLMLFHAFERLGCLRVELKTDALNERSRRAIQRIGAREEGTLRKHMVTASGRVRDTVLHSIVDDEWPAVRVRLEAMMARR